MPFNEDSRVKIPTILHLIRLGYTYLKKQNEAIDKTTNIFTHHFDAALKRLNPELDEKDRQRALADLKLELNYDDLGKAFYETLTQGSGIRFIDFENFSNNSFHVVTELTYQKDEDSFRPDITILINGLPLVFIEVKKPSNAQGIQAEFNRIETRFKNKQFKAFANITQFMIFSNNMEYDDQQNILFQGAFYASPSYGKCIFNYLREEETFDLTAMLSSISNTLEDDILKDNNLQVIKHSPEFKTNKDPNKPTNRICTSLLSKERLAFLLRYGFAYVAKKDGLQKHIMRYPQIFATLTIKKDLSDNIHKGIVWHTQGSGKTALAYFNVKHLKHYYRAQRITPKFYFIVDRLDLLNQAAKEFNQRGLIVHTVQSKEAFAQDIKSLQVVHNDQGRSEITVVNIQKFQDDPNVIAPLDYGVNIQRIFFLDEVHRSYNPKGSFLANLVQSDPNAILIGLTGTPLISSGKNKKDDFASKEIFGDYFHKYYYNASIKDGYTLRLIREEIESSYKLKLAQVIADHQIDKKSIDLKKITAHPRFIKPMLDYIISDFEGSRLGLNDASIGAMVICDSSEQARALYERFQVKYAAHQEPELLQAAEPEADYTVQHKVKSAALILHDQGSKEERKNEIDAFKNGHIDILFVYNMLLTGFDAPRLKKLYLNRVVKQHNLLQALTRVNRTYKQHRYGYVVDFADISQEFDATNQAYFNELQDELGDEFKFYSNLFKSQQDIDEEILQVKNQLFQYDIGNAERFSEQIQAIEDKSTLQELKKVLENAKNLYNMLRSQLQTDQLDRLDFKKLHTHLDTVNHHLAFLNDASKLAAGEKVDKLLNIALEDLYFQFRKVGESELKLADEFKDELYKTRQTFKDNFDPKDPEFIGLKEALENLFKKKSMREVTQEEIQGNLQHIRRIHKKIREHNRKDENLRNKYQGDAKFARVHKRIVEQGTLSVPESQIYETLLDLKQGADDTVLKNNQSIQNEAYFKRSMNPILVTAMKQHQITMKPAIVHFINQLVMQEYFEEYKNGDRPW
tara:strand:- start:2077 stop:5154 length:3078 start_codon:yes stop_codon:yes gene_type:complete